jgi:hypothetical protein
MVILYIRSGWHLVRPSHQAWNRSLHLVQPLRLPHERRVSPVLGRPIQMYSITIQTQYMYCTFDILYIYLCLAAPYTSVVRSFHARSASILKPSSPGAMP